MHKMNTTIVNHWAATFAASQKACEVKYAATKPKPKKQSPPVYPTCWKCTAIFWGFTVSTIAIIGILIFT